MFDLFKTNDRAFDFDDRFSGRLSSALEAFLIEFGSEWEDPCEEIKTFKCVVYPSGLIGFEKEDAGFTKGTYNVYLKDVRSLRSISEWTITAIQSFATTPYIYHEVEYASDEILSQLKAIHARHQLCSE